MLYCNIYLLKLDEGLLFLYSRPCDECSADRIAIEFKALYPDYPLMQDITVIIHNVKACDIDSLVLHYMHKFGLDKVRGGSYSARHLSDTMKTFIGDRIKFVHFDLPDIHNLLMSYDCEVIGEVVKLRNKIDSLKPSLSDFELTVLKTLFRQSPLTNINSNPQLQVYNNILASCSKLYYQFKDQCQNGMDDLQKMLGFQSHIWLYSPHVAFDDYYLYGKDKDLAEKILNCFEFMKTYMSNRIAELEFDISQLQKEKSHQACLETLES